VWDTTSFFKVPPEERWVVIRDLQHPDKSKCVIEERAWLAKHDSAVLARLKHKAAEHVRLVDNRVVGSYLYNEIAVCETFAALEALRGEHESDTTLAKALRDQIRVRNHVYGIKQKDLPYIGSDAAALAIDRLMSELGVLVLRALPRKPPPVPYPVRSPHPAPTQAANALDLEHIHKLAAAFTEMLKITREGVFVARRSAAPHGFAL
jgi:hypothetical protein